MQLTITFLVSFMLILTVTFTVGQDMMESFIDITASWMELRERSEVRAETRIAGPTDLSLTSTTDVDITITNEGDVPLSSFEDWDVIFEVQEASGFSVLYLDYTTSASPSTNEWTVSGIYLDATLLTAEVVIVMSTTDVDITITNEGDVPLSSFEDWDVIFEVQEASGFSVLYLDYTTSASPSTNEWTVSGIYLDATLLTAEVVDPNILNPGEEMIIKANPLPAVTSGTYDRAVFVTPNGVIAKVIFKLSGFLHVVDQADRIVYRYTDEGVYVDLNSLDSANTDAQGITTDGTDFWVPDEVDDEAYKYDSSVNLDSMWSLDLQNATSTGVTTDGTNIWVVDGDDTVYKYDMVGASVSNFSLDAANTAPAGITTDNTNIWVVDSGDDLVYKYDLSGVFDSTFALSAENADPSGITTDGANIWVVDKVDDKVYKYDMTGSNISTATFDLDATNTDPTGITVKPR